MKQMTCKRLLLTMALMLFVVFFFIACASKQADTSVDVNMGEEAPVATSPAWSTKSDCGSCHEAEISSETDAMSMYSTHVSAGVTCSTCHIDDEGKLAEAHIDYAAAELPTKLRITEVTESVCLTCHDKEELQAKTTASTALTDSNGIVVNPHSLPATEKHEGNINCSSCHNMHLPNSPVDQGQEVCSSCHHMQVYECGTCHE